MSTNNIYADAETTIRERLLARPKARGQGKSRQFIDRTAALGVWFLRKHGPYGERIFSACRMVLAKLLKLGESAVRRSIAALQEIGLLQFLPRADGRTRKWRSVEYAAYQFQLGLDFANFFVAAQTDQRGAEKEEVSSSLSVSGRLVPARTWDPQRPEFRLPSKAAVKRAAGAALEALQRLPLPLASPALLATLRRPAGGSR